MPSSTPCVASSRAPCGRPRGTRGLDDLAADDLYVVRIFEPGSRRACRRRFLRPTGRTSLDTSLSLGLRTELRVRHLHRKDAGQAFTQVVAGHLDLLFVEPFEVMYLVMVRVIAARRPVRWVPPSRCGMLLVKHHVLAVAIVPLHRHFNSDAILRRCNRRCSCAERSSPCSCTRQSP